jgi:hypothetical protein
MKESREDIVRRIFQPYHRRYRGRNYLYKNIHAYRGKHYLERNGSDYLSKYEFEDLLKSMGIYPIKPNSDLYPLQIRKEYYIGW